MTDKPQPPHEPATLTEIIEVWKKVVEVQMHFNDMGMRARNFVVLLLGAYLAAIGIALDESVTASFFGIEAHLGFWLSPLAILIIACFAIIDFFWFSRLLSGAVRHGEYIEKRVEASFPELSLARKIRETNEDGKFFFFWKPTSKKKLATFYMVLIFAVLISAIMFWNITPSDIGIQ
ncbi:MAG: hypothetical protein CMH91_08295 [Oceanicaulis sp.]|uniref:hypothetical protein n=1 Tax=unclassified Oceanicaulis TaxID=2632123 RepID=UPI000C64F046|nr:MULTISPECIES: hypothetical protein [unclassified Oceanicaulis]MAB70133.1 hypothetical protein [Oceanicaulis sp.]MBC39044.1 hypothetical protein [Oceanicaulis sp.]MBG34702.1 hypothetical protein [Oceanicaulis sp.]MBG37039.1 hypothetical protein [Oceanicaulis sp.]HBU63715.1 hypothetical protein [Oceanicaulis sp.]|tara:strand:+ start:6889 stop:7419 length:531 start_codon:yes stop_codon:yes gene_type:complete